MHLQSEGQIRRWLDLLNPKGSCYERQIKLCGFERTVLGGYVDEFTFRLNAGNVTRHTMAVSMALWALGGGAIVSQVRTSSNDRK